MQTQLQLESYQIPSFYDALNRYGVQQISPDDDFIVYRGRIGTGEIRIDHIGRVQFSADPLMEEAITYALDVVDEPVEVRKQQYVVLANHISTEKKLESHHLNVWLTLDQYYAAIAELEKDKLSTEIKAIETFQERIFQRNGFKIYFHTNGKVISEEGYEEFAPFIRNAISKHHPFADYDIIIGQDEVGSGEKIGPLVIASVALTPEQMIELQLLGAKDSKLVPGKVTASLAPLIRKHSLAYQTLQVDPVEFNQMDPTPIVEILRWGHNKVAYQILEKLDLEDKKVLLLLDKFDYHSTLLLETDPLLDLRVEHLISGESKAVSIAAASILARASRYLWIDNHEKAFHIKLSRKYLRELRHHTHAYELIRY